MNGEGPSVPITTLAGIQSLTDLLLELPIPTPLPGATGTHRSLLSHAGDAEEAQRLLASPHDSFLVPQLLEALGHTTLDQVEVKDGYCGRNAHCGQTSPLLQYLVNHNPAIFGGLASTTTNNPSPGTPASVPTPVASTPIQPPTPGSSPWMQSQFSPNAIYSQPASSSSFSASHLSSCSPHSNSPQFPAQESPSYYDQCGPQSVGGGSVGGGGHPQVNLSSPAPVIVQNSGLSNLSQPKQQVNSFSYAQMIGQEMPVLQNNNNPSALPVHIGTNNFPNNCSPQTPSSISDDKSLYQTSAIMMNDKNTVALPVPLNSLSNGDCESNDKTFSPSDPQVDFFSKNTPDVTNKIHASYDNINNNITHVLKEGDHLINSQCPENCNDFAIVQEQLKQEFVTHTSEPSHRKVANSVSEKAYANPIPRDFIQTSCTVSLNDISLSAVTGVKPNKPESRRKSVNEPIVVLEKMTIEDQVLAQKSIRQFTKKVVKPLLTSSDEEGEVTPSKKQNCDSTIIKENSKKRSTPTSNKKETNYRVFTSKRKGKEEEEEKNSSKAVKRNLENDYKFNNTISESAKKRRRNKPQKSSYAESPISGEEGLSDKNNESNFSIEEEVSNAVIVEKKSPKKATKKRMRKEIDENIEELMDTNTYQNFTRVVESIFDAMEEIDFTAELDENAAIPEEALIPLFRLKELCSQAAKMKKLEVMNHFPADRLARLLTILERNVLDGAKLLPVQDEQDEDESKLWLELTMERVTRSVDSALTCMYIMTSPDMPEKVFLEDIIERVVMFVKFQLRNTVYPVFDPAYRVDPKAKDGYSGSIKQKRAHAHKIRHKSIIQLYNKLHEIVGLTGELLDLQNMTDTIILQMSTLGISPFFVEGVSELQLLSLRLVTTIFAGYPKHRSLILEDILASIARLPTSKRSLRNYRLNSEENIQMLTALVLQLMHSIVQLPEPVKDHKPMTFLGDKKDSKRVEKNSSDISKAERDLSVMASHDAASSAGVNFLSVFLKKCATKNEDMDYRPLFENFVQDLLSTVNKPEWPASEMLLSRLGHLLVQNFSSKSIEMSLRVASLDYLGVVAARLRKDAVSSQEKREAINEVIHNIVEQNLDEDDCPLSSLSSSKGKKSKHTIKLQKKDEIQVLQKALLNYLDDNLHSDPTLIFARRFYIVQWYKDADLELRAFNDRLKKSDNSALSPPASSTPSTPSKSNKGKHQNRHKRSSSSANLEEDYELFDQDEIKKEFENDTTDKDLITIIEERKQFLLSVAASSSEKNSKMKEKANSLDYETAELVSKFLAAKRQFSNSFDVYLSKILSVLKENTVAVRTKAMKCLSLVVEADPGILARPDMEASVYNRFLDQSTSVREAAVDLVGKFILIRPELTHQYYKMLTGRIVDTGVSVRKRVIKIFKDVCLEQPDFPEIPEICVLMIRRVNDEDGIKKLVGEVFQSMWFTPVPDKNVERILQKVKTITHVVSACKDVGIEWFEQLLMNLLKAKEDANVKPVIKSCKQIVDCLIENVMRLEESPQDAAGSENLAACFTTLCIFSKIQPQLIVPHATTIQPYLSFRSESQQDIMIVQNVALILQKVVPLMDHPSESFLAQIEEDIVKLILRHTPSILTSCVSCLGAVINKVTKNFQLVKDCFQKFFVTLLGFKKKHEANPDDPIMVRDRGRLSRSLLTVGLFCKHFDSESINLDQNNLQDSNWFFDVVIYFTAPNHDQEVRRKALTGLGLLLIRHYEHMIGPQVKELYQSILTDTKALPSMKVQVLKNLNNYLSEEEARLVQKDSEWNKISKSEDLKEMDASSGMASTVIQIYLKQVLDTVLHPHEYVRKAALQVIQLTLAQGLVHPVQIVPYLICLGSDDDIVVRTKADNLLQEIEKKYPGFVQMKALMGVQMSFKLQQVVKSKTKELVRGHRIADQASSRNGFLYTVIRGTRQNRRAFVLSLLKRFDEQLRTSLQEMLYLADNMVYFPFQAQDEPLFIIHHIDVMLSVTGSNLLQTFREGLVPRNNNKSNKPCDNIETTEKKPLIDSVSGLPSTTNNLQVVHPPEEDDDEDDDFDSIVERLPVDTTALQECITASQGCVLLLFLKQTLKDLYGFTDGKIQQYSPNEQAKVFEKALNRKNGVSFKPTAVLEFLQQNSARDASRQLDESGRQEVVNHYLNFKQLMLTIDPVDDDDEEDTGAGAAIKKPLSASLRTFTNAVSADTNRTKTTIESGDSAVIHETPIPNSTVVPVSAAATPKHSRTSSSSSRSRTKHKTPKSSSKEKVKKKHKKKRRRILESDDSGDNESDPDYE